VARTFAGFEILQKVGQGGMGAVYKAFDPKLKRIVALKVMNPGVASPEAYARFEREIRVISRLRHPNIVRLFQVGQHKNRVWFTMDYIEGQTLAELIEQAKTMPEREELVHHLATIARAVHYAHEQGIIHRDLKPSNIIIDENGSPVLTDFGLAKEMGAGGTVTIDGQAIGSVHYMSPEQARGELDKIGPASDVWSLGALLYEILTGRPPFDGPTPAAILRNVLREDPTPPRRLNRAIPRALEAICLKCLAKDPEPRYAGAEPLAEDIDHYLAGEWIAAKRRDVVGRLLRTTRSHPWAIPVAGLAAVFAAIGLAFLFVQHEMVPRKAQAQQEAHERASPGAVPPGAVARKAEAQQKTRELAQAEARISSYYCPNWVFSIAASGDEVWWGVYGGVFQADLLSGVKTFYPAQGHVSAITRDEQGQWWFGIGGGALAHFDGHVFRMHKAPVWSPTTMVSAVAIDAEGRKWLGSSRGACCFDGETWKTYTTKDGLAHNRVGGIAVDGEGRLWFSAGRGGVSCFDGETWKTYTTKDGLAHNRVLAMAVDGEGRLWFGTPRGVSRFDGKIWKRYTRRDGLADNYVWAIAVDGEGRLWVGTPGDGLSCFDGETWTAFRTPGFLSQLVMAVAVDRAGVKWFGTDRGVSCFDGETWRTYTRMDGLANDYVTSIAVDPAGRVWFGTGSGVSVFDGKSWKTYTPKEGPGNNAVLAIAVDLQGRVWCGSPTEWGARTQEGGVLCFEGEAWKNYRVEDGLASNYVNAVAPDAEGRVWFGCQPETEGIESGGGVSCFDGKSWKTYTKKDGLASNFVKAVAIDRRGRKWFGTAGAGVSCFDGKTWTTYTTKHGLGSNRVYAIVADHEGRVWFGCQPEGDRLGGVSCFDGKTWRTWDWRGSLCEDHVNCLAVDLDGSIWAATMGGVSHIVLY